MRPGHDVSHPHRDRLVALGAQIGLLRVGRPDRAHYPQAIRFVARGRGCGGKNRPERTLIFVLATSHLFSITASMAWTKHHVDALYYPWRVRLVIAECQVDYSGQLAAHLPMGKRLIMIKADGSVSIHADNKAYKPLNWMNSPCTLRIMEPDCPELGDTVRPVIDQISEVWQITGKNDDRLIIAIKQIELDHNVELGIDPGLRKDGVEAHLQALLAENPETFGSGWTLVRREFPTAIGPVDLMCRNTSGEYVAVEVKRRGEVDGVEQLTRYLELLNRDPLLGTVKGVFAAQAIKPQARVLAMDRGIECVVVDYDELRGIDHSADRLF